MKSIKIFFIILGTIIIHGCSDNAISQVNNKSILSQ